MATYYYRNVATGWNVTTSWSTTSSSGSSAGATPTNLDDVIIDAGSNASCTVTSAGTCKSITLTNYTGTVTINTGITLTISGNVTLGTGMTLAGAGTWIVNATSSLTSNGLTFTRNFTCSSAVTLTFVDNWTFSGTTTFTSCVLNRTTSIAGNLTISGTLSTNVISGTSQITLKSLTHAGTGTLTNPIVVDAGVGTYSFTGTMTGVTSITYISGTTNMNTSTVQLANGATLNTNSTNTTSVTSSTGINFYNLTLTPNSTPGCTITTSSNITACGLLQNATGNSSVTISGTFTVYANGSFTVNTNGGGALASPSITANNIVMGGTGTLTMTNTGLSGPLTINTAGTVTINSFIGNLFTYTAGTIVSTSAAFSCAYSAANSGNINISAPGIQWNTFLCNIAATIILNATLTVTTMTLTTGGGVSIAFAGSSGFTVGTLSSTAAVAGSNLGITLGAGNTYTVTSTLNLYSPTIGTYLGFKSGTPGSVTYFILTQGATQSIGNIQPTDIDSSGGQTIWAWRPGILSNTVNWKTLTNPGTVVSTF